VMMQAHTKGASSIATLPKEEAQALVQKVFHMSICISYVYMYFICLYVIHMSICISYVYMYFICLNVFHMSICNVTHS